MQSIPVGATGSFSLVVMPDHLASRFKDVTLPPVLATPYHPDGPALSALAMRAAVL
jgi:hypothetical protein